MIPVVALVGRPNVGKSTLFNRLTKTKDALVADYAGLTRDRKYGQATFENYHFIVIDTGGLDGDESGIHQKMAQQSLAAMDEADVIWFLVDARAGLNAADEAIAQYLRTTSKPIYIVANKCDGIDPNIACNEFYALALGDVYPIAASHGRGVRSLLEQQTFFKNSPELSSPAVDAKHPPNQDDPLDQTSAAYLAYLQTLPIKLAIVGRPNVGKSTLTNRILGEERVVVYDMPGTTRDSVYIPMERDGQAYTLIDTAGVRKRKKVHEAIEKFSIVKTLKAIEDSNVVLLVIDSTEGISDQDLSLLSYTLKAGRALVIAVNKWDGLDQEVKADIKRELDRRLNFIDFAELHFISALHGSGVGHLFESVQRAYQSATTRISTSLLTRLVKLAQEDHQPPMYQGRRIKLKYAHAGGYNPPIIVIHGNQVNKLPDSYKRYLNNFLRQALKIQGSPLHLSFQEGDNPYQKTSSYNRRRILKHIGKKK